MTIGFAILLNNECHNFIRKVQLEIHQQIGIGQPRQTPHITIKSPFEVNTLDAYVDYFEELANRLKPFDIEFDGFGTFGERVLYLNVKENSDLIALHANILQEVKEKFDLDPHEFEGENIKFHASIAGFDNADDFHKAEQLLSKYQPKYRFRAIELGLFYYLGAGNGWIVQQRIKI